jgi:hypothetical protein
LGSHPMLQIPSTVNKRNLFTRGERTQHWKRTSRICTYI